MNGRRTVGVIAIVLAAAAVPVGLAAANGASMIGPATNVTGVSLPKTATPDEPTEAQLRQAYSDSLECLAAEGLDVKQSTLTVTRYDVQAEFEFDTHGRGDLTDAESARDAICRAPLADLSTAWTAASDFPFAEVDAAFDRCVEGAGGKPATARESDPDMFGRCMGQARAEVLGLPAS